MKRNYSLLFFYVLLTCSCTYTCAQTATKLRETVTDIYTPTEITRLKTLFFNNITAQGAIIASPSTDAPNYYFDWIRDSAVAMELVARWYDRQEEPVDKEKLLNYVDWTQKIQHQNSPNPLQDIIGEPKFNLDGTPYTGPWGRPQNDGPALRAIALIRFANTLLKHPNTADSQYVQKQLYAGGLDAATMGAIKIDLEYVAHHWQEKNYDLWEEVYGNHFFTEMVQRKALIEGAVLAKKLNDPLAAAFYTQQANLISAHLHAFINPNTHYIQATLTPHPGPQKTDELDTAVILGVLVGNTADSLFSPQNHFIENTVIALKNQFKSLYPLNQSQDILLFGRYPGDTYDGYRTDSQGNPWFILTATMAEYYYTKANHLSKTPGNHQRILNAIMEADAYLHLIKHYAPDLSMREQINLTTGIQQGADSLTWGYVAVLRAIEARETLLLGNATRGQ